MKTIFSVIFILGLLISSLVSASAATLVWDNGDPNPVGGYIVGWGPTQAAPSSSGNSGPIDSTPASCNPGTDNNDTYDCSFPIPGGLVTEGQTLWFTVKAFNYNVDGSSCGAACESAWATPVSYTNQGTGSTGTKPGVPTGVKLLK